MTRDQAPIPPKRETTPYEKLQAALIKSGAARLAVIAGPNVSGPAGSDLEFWNVPTPNPGRLVIVQKWTGKHVYGGWDAYVQIGEHNTDKAIREVIGDRRIEERRKENTTHGQIRRALELGITESRRLQDRRKPT